MNPILIIYLIIACMTSLYSLLKREADFIPSFLTGIFWPITVLFLLVFGIVGILSENKKEP